MVLLRKENPINKIKIGFISTKSSQNIQNMGYMHIWSINRQYLSDSFPWIINFVCWGFYIVKMIDVTSLHYATLTLKCFIHAILHCEESMNKVVKPCEIQSKILIWTTVYSQKLLSKQAKTSKYFHSIGLPATSEREINSVWKICKFSCF